MNKDRRRSILPSLISALLLVAVFVAAEVLYGFTKYLPLCLFALTCLLPAGFNLIVMLTYLKLPLKKVQETADESEEPSELSDTAENGKKKVTIPTVFTAAPKVLEAFAKTEYAERLKATGVITSYICPLMYMNNPLCKKMPVITSSNKLRTYTTARYYTDAEILQTITGGKKA